MDKNFFLSHFALGLYLGLVFAGAGGLHRIIRLKFELGGYKRH